jgi:hypothetical protein
MTAIPAGARCATHPYVGAIYLCARCGTFLCTECAGDREAFVDGFRRSAERVPELAVQAELAWVLTEFGGPVASPVWYATWLGASAGAWWIGLRLVSGVVSYREILRGLSYTNVLAGLGLVTLWLSGPATLFAMLVLGLWGSVLQILAMTRLTGGDIGRAAGAFLVSILVLSLGACTACITPTFLPSMSRL